MSKEFQKPISLNTTHDVSAHRSLEAALVTAVMKVYFPDFGQFRIKIFPFLPKVYAEVTTCCQYLPEALMYMSINKIFIKMPSV